MRPPYAAGATLRFVALGSSIVSDWGNPAATSIRAVLNAIAAAGHEVTFLEQRGNPTLAALLANRGSRAYKVFTERYPRIQFRTYDLPGGWQRTVWFGSEIAIADVIVTLPGTPETLLPEIAAVPSPHVAKLIDELLPIAGAGFRLVRVAAERGDNDLVFGPAVEPADPGSQERSPRPLLVAYDDPADAIRLAAELADRDPELIVTGTADLPGWTYVPEVELPDRYASHQTAIVSGAGDASWAEARRLLPHANGCATLDEATDLEHKSFVPVPHGNSAQVQANLIIAAIQTRLGR